MSKGYIKPARIKLKADPEFNEKWVEKLISDDPSIVGLGALELVDKQKIQPNAGRLDLLLRDPESKRRYEVELQLGRTDASHIIRCIEYWDIERKRYPQYDHCAVLIAEDVTSRFLNVISLFNGTLPLIAIQMRALRVGDFITLVFTTVMDELTRGFVDEDESVGTTTDRAYWESKATKGTVKLVDKLLVEFSQFDLNLSPNYLKHYIGIKRDGRVGNFVKFKPKKSRLNLDLKLSWAEETDKFIEDSDLDLINYTERWGEYTLGLTREDVKNKSDAIRFLSESAYRQFYET